MKNTAIVVIALAGCVALSGCSSGLFSCKSDKETIQKLTSDLEAANKEKQALEERLAKEARAAKDAQHLAVKVGDLEKAREMLQEKLAKEIGDKDILLKMANNGLTISVANDILFSSGKAELSKNAEPVLAKVASVLKEAVPDRDVGVEGHTDNMPIRHSAWKSNWELSTARSTSVVHYLIDMCGIAPQRLSAIGYGEFRPIDSNDTKVQRAHNRRVEIIILPKDMTKRSYEEVQSKISQEAKHAEEDKVAVDEK